MDTLTGILSSKLASELMGKLSKGTSQSKCETLASWVQEQGVNGVSKEVHEMINRGIEDCKDMLYQNDLILKPLLKNEQSYE